MATVENPSVNTQAGSLPRIIVIGAGSRGQGYARALKLLNNGVITAVADPDEFKRMQLGRNFIWGDAQQRPEGSVFHGWREFVTWETSRRARVAAGEKDVPPGVDAVFVCVQDSMHREVVVALAELGGLHILCEKPLATTLEDCVDIYRALRTHGNAGGESTLFAICHVLRYSPHNMMLRKLLLEDRVIGDIVSVAHTEPVGWWHFTHSYVRGNWRRESTSGPSLLTKSCHDIDVLMWLLCSPTSSSLPGSPRPHAPSTVSSTGSLQYFKKSRKPAAAGSATNCFSCPAEHTCKYSAKRIYVGNELAGLGSGNTGWPVKIVLPDIESYGEGAQAAEALVSELAKDYDESTPGSQVSQRNWFGRCVYESDNDVCDEQVVTITWDEDPLPRSSILEAGASGMEPAVDPLQGRGGKTAVFHMVAQTKRICERYTHVYGVEGEIYADSTTITVEDFNTGRTATYHPRIEDFGHGGGDLGLVRQFVSAVDKVKNAGWTVDKAQKKFIGCTLEEVIRSHAMVFCAEEARKTQRVIDWAGWWAEKVEGKLDAALT